MNSAKETVYRRNVVGVSVVEFFWGLGFPVVLESTFLQLFLKSLGASSFAIGMVPSLFIAGISCFPILASYLARNCRYQRPLVLLLHLVSALSVLGFGTFLLGFGRFVDVLPFFFVSYGLFSICIGMTIPIWLNYLVRIFPDSRTVQGLGYMMLFQNIGKIVASFFILQTVERYAFSLHAAAFVFIATGLCFAAGSLCFLLTREVADPEVAEPDRRSFFVHTVATLREILANRRFLVFLAADLDFYVILTVIAFYANYATGFFAVPPAIAAGFFVACIYAGSITVNVLLGMMDLLSLKQKFVLSKLVTLTLLVLLIMVPGQLVFYAVSFLLGFARAIHNVVYPPSVKHFSGKPDSTSYFSVAPLLTLPFAAGFPLAFGELLDRFAHLGEDSYRLLFAVAAVIVVAILLLSLKTDYES